MLELLQVIYLAAITGFVLFSIVICGMGSCAGRDVCGCRFCPTGLLYDYLYVIPTFYVSFFGVLIYLVMTQ